MSAADAIEPRSASLEISIYDPPQLQRLATRWFHLRPARRGKTNCPKGGSASIRTGCPSGPLRAFPEKHDARGAPDRSSVVQGKRVSLRVDLGGRRILTQKHRHRTSS